MSGLAGVLEFKTMPPAIATHVRAPLPERKLLVFDTHPIQYRSPVFRALALRHREMKVCFFDDTFDGRKWWFNEVGKIPRQEWELELREGYPHEVMGMRALSPFARFRALARCFQQEAPSAVAMYGYYMIEHWMVRWLCARHGIPLIFIGETFENRSRGLRGMIRKPLLSWFFKGVKRFISVGDRTRAYYQGRGVKPERIVPARYCVDSEFFAMMPEQSLKERMGWRLQENLPDDAFVILFVGRLFDRKRPLDVVELQRRLSRDPRVHTVIVGNGPDEAMLKHVAKGVPRLHFLGFRNQVQVRSCYHGADILVVPSEFETWGLVVNEAFACRLPAVVTDTCGVATDLVVNDETGFVYPSGNLDALTEKVGWMANHTSQKERLGANAYRKVTKDYGVEQFADAYVNALASLD